MSKIDDIFAAINEIRDARKAATPGPWKFTPADECDDWMIYNSEFTFVKQDDSGVPVSKEDGEFLVMACNRISALASALEVAVSTLEEISRARGTEAVVAEDVLVSIAEILEDRK